MTVIHGADLSLEKWLELVLSGSDTVFPNNCFPTDQMMDEYLEIIENRTEKDVKDLIRCFLVHTGSYGKDKELIRSMRFIEQSDHYELQQLHSRLKQTEYYSRLMYGIPWEGLTWILDLLPHFPKKSLEGISAYLLANINFLPDYPINGLEDAMTLIRAKFIEKLHPRDIFLSLEPDEFELLVEELYSNMGYTTQLTKRTGDSGIDIIAQKESPGTKEKVFIQCKRYKNKVGQPAVRDLVGTVHNYKATKGILISCAHFTKPAKKFLEGNHQIELIDHIELTKLLNEYLGSNWPNMLDRIVVKKLATERV